MKIACVHSCIGTGGADRRMVDLANVLSKQGNDVHFYVMANSNNNRFHFDTNIKVQCIAKKSKIPKTQFLFNIFSLRKRLIEDKIDLAISFLYPTNIQLLFAKVRTNVKTIISERGNPQKQPSGGIWKFLRDKTYPKTDGIVFQTEGARKYYVDNLKLDGCVIHNPVDVGLVVAKTSGNKVISSVGRLDVHKNQKRLIYAFHLFLKEHPDYKLRICGGGYMESELKEYASALDIAEKIMWMGNIPEPYKVIAEDEFFVLSSDYEGMPNALMEAMAIGMPCISTDCAPGGARELITDGENGLLCVLDNGEDLAKKMSIIAENKELAFELSKNALNLKETHSPNLIYLHWTEYIKEIFDK